MIFTPYIYFANQRKAYYFHQTSLKKLRKNMTERMSEYSCAGLNPFKKVLQQPAALGTLETS